MTLPAPAGERARFVAVLLVVALGGGGFAIAFRALLAFVYQQAYGAPNVVEAIASLPPWLRCLVPLAGAACAGLIGRLRRAGPQGVSNVMEAVALGNVRLSLRTTVNRVLASFTAIATGLSIGREGPLIEFGGSLGATLGRASGMPLTRTRALVAAGTAAGFAAAYNTPFAAVLFVFETIVGIAALEALLPTTAAVVAATALTRGVIGGGPIYGQRTFEAGAPWELLSFAMIGVLGTLTAIVFRRGLGLAERIVEDHPLRQPWRAALGGLVVGIIAVWLPQVAGNGFEPLNLLLDGALPARLFILLLVAKLVATWSSVASGVPGGVFTPVLLAGGLAGALWAQVLAGAGLGGSHVGSYALVGMAAATAATLHAPLTAAVLVFELAGDYAIVLPLLLATVVATSLSRWLGATSLYEAELQRRGVRWTLTLEGRRTDRGA